MTTFISKTLAALTLATAIFAASPSMAGWTNNGWGTNGWTNNGWGTNGWSNGQTVQSDGHALRITGIELPR